MLAQTCERIKSIMEKRKPTFSKKKLESILQQITPFEKPQVEFEQYQTPPDLAAELLLSIDRLNV